MSEEKELTEKEMERTVGGLQTRRVDSDEAPVTTVYGEDPPETISEPSLVP